VYSKPGICDSACAFINEESRAGGEKKTTMSHPKLVNKNLAGAKYAKES
jgi:hypothetical protein